MLAGLVGPWWLPTLRQHSSGYDTRINNFGHREKHFASATDRPNESH
jgi:hypothetical protein